ncbi:MAG: assimilatory sulfite reductase (NADPH) flavoprotein subunit [Gammaproteobacteria bacterium]|nr:assimilatory sulfite reductase (NADPH) flavoprotein subunit [Gammaproteobacteria bacterium]
MLANLIQEFASPLSKEQVKKVNEALCEMSIEQVNWLGGYLAGVAAIGASAGIRDLKSVIGESAEIVSALSTNSQVSQNSLQLDENQQSEKRKQSTILYGSQTGNARGVAEQLHKALLSFDIDAKLVDMSEFNPKHLKKLERVFIVVSTHGEGEPPDDALELHEFVHSKKFSVSNTLEFAVLGLGDTSYEYFCQTAKDFDAAFSKAGAKRLFDRIDCDVDYQSDVDNWNSLIVDILKQESVDTQKASLESSPKACVSETNSKPQLKVISTTQEFNKLNPYLAEILSVYPITSPDANKSTFHVEIDLNESGIEYQPGDSLGVWPVNSDDLINEIIEIQNWNSEELILLDSKERSLREYLKYDLELTQVTPGFVKWISEKNQSNSLKEIVASKEKLRELIEISQVVELLKQYPVNVKPDEFLSQLRSITPRLYSIASSQIEVEEEVHLTVGLVAEERNGNVRFGAASDYLSRVKEGDKVRVYVEPNKHFKLPDSAQTPIIMIGAGTGVAPFRSFVQERSNLDESPIGESWLFFGNQHFTEDFLYQLEWQKHLKDGVLSKLDLAFSRDQAEKVYVQDKLLSKSEEVFQWIKKGAHLYLCGAQKTLGKSVDVALIQIIASQSCVSEEQAKLELLALKKQGRYQKDVY